MAIRDHLVKILSNYKVERQNDFKNNWLANYIRRDTVYSFQLLEDCVCSKLSVVASPGQGQWAEVPWLAIFDEAVTDTIEQGVYIVYLFKPDGSGVYLAMGQGVKALEAQYGAKYWPEQAKSQREAFIKQAKFKESRFDLNEIFIEGEGKLAAKYEKAIFFSIYYELNSMPEEDILVDDLKSMISRYKQYVVYHLSNIDSGFSEEIKQIKAVTGAKISLVEEKRFRVHRFFEGRAQTKMIKKEIGYTCQACNFNFEEKYGELGRDYIEAHHIVPYANLEKGNQRELTAKDFLALCANCHRIIHRLINKSKSEVSLHDLKKIILKA